MVIRGKMRVALQQYRVAGLDKPLVRPVLPLLVGTRSSAFRAVEFIVDTGAGITTIAVVEAAGLHLSVPTKKAAYVVHTATGRAKQIRRPGRLCAKIPGLGERVFDWPCHFVEHEASAPKAVLGLAGVLDDLRITLDGTYALEAPYGWLILEEVGRA
jgi:hypothetical protein